MRGDPCGNVYCGSICEGICSAAEDTCAAIDITTSSCRSVGAVLVSLFLRYFLGFHFVLFFPPLGQCDVCGSINKPCFLFHLQTSPFLWVGSDISSSAGQQRKGDFHPMQNRTGSFLVQRQATNNLVCLLDMHQAVINWGGLSVQPRSVDHLFLLHLRCILYSKCAKYEPTSVVPTRSPIY